MASWRKGRVTEILEQRPGLVRAAVDVDGQYVEVAAFPAMVGALEVGDMLVLNATGLDLDLGTGGIGFVLWNLDNKVLPEAGPGHIIKMRYTPWQTEVPAAEAPESPHHAKLRDADSLDGMPVVVCSLHSQMAAAAAGIKAAAPETRVGYLMTDGAALPLAWSDLLRQVQDAKLIDVTCTAGHAFGGDLEAVNVFSGLVALRHAAETDIVVAAMGPGIIGTGTRLGFTGMEQGQVLDAVTALGGHSIACLRISFADDRDRHRGVSHHSLTALSVAAREPTTFVVPFLPKEQLEVITEDLQQPAIGGRHFGIASDGAPALQLLKELGIHVSSMGRRVEEIPELFLAAGAAGDYATWAPRHPGLPTVTPS